MSSRDPKVFISSTGKDLVQYRQAALKVCRQLQLHTVAMEDFVPSGKSPTDGSIAKVDEATIYVGIFAYRYGTLGPCGTKSITHLEFERAGERKLDRLCFLLDPSHPWPPGFIDEDRRQIQSFKTSIDKSLIRGQFKEVADFESLLYRSLAEWKQAHGQSATSTEVVEIDWRRDLCTMAYLRWLWSEQVPVRTLGLGGASGTEEIDLWRVYTALDVESRVHLDSKDDRLGGLEALGEWAEEPSGEAYRESLRQRLVEEAEHKKKAPVFEESRREIQTHRYQRPLAAVEAASLARRLVLVGPAGSGKSTFARYLALAMAGGLLERKELDLSRLGQRLPSKAEEGDGLPGLPWPHGALLPCLVELRRFVRFDGFPAEKERGTAQHLFQYLASVLFEAQARPNGESQSEQQEHLRQRCAQVLQAALGKDGGDVLLVLDGLDETPGADWVRTRLKEIIAGFARSYPACRIVVTSRPYAYQRSQGRLDGAGFASCELAPFGDREIPAFIGAWYGQLARCGQINADQAQRHSGLLWQEIQRQSYLQELASRPLTLTMMTDVHAEHGGAFRDGRAGLYGRSVELLVDRWNQMRDVLEGKTLADHLGLEEGDLCRTLERLAYEVHRKRGEASSGEPSEIRAEELLVELAEERRRRGAARPVDLEGVAQYLHQRSGILLGDSPTLYRFPHRSYQEFLAACHLTKIDFPDQLLKEVEAVGELWREVVPLAAGKLQEAPHSVWTLVAGLVPAAPSRTVKRSDPGHLRALLAGLCLEETGLWKRVQARDRATAKRLIKWLRRTLSQEALSPVDRSVAGRVLGRLGDPRPGAGAYSSGVPDIAWKEVPGGRSWLGSRADDPERFDQEQPWREEEVASFSLGRYPVTNAQYAAFVVAGGYTEACREYWDEEGWLELGKAGGPDDDQPEEFLVANAPRVNVSWWEAQAFCRWLAAITGEPVRLPLEEEWERAARGEDGRAYAWGPDFEPGRCNSREGGIGRTTAVGSFRSGRGPFGHDDLTGNVFEWCDSRFKELGGSNRVFRGGSWSNPAQFCRAAYRYGGPPGFRFVNIGFRLARTHP